MKSTALSEVAPQHSVVIQWGPQLCIKLSNAFKRTGEHERWFSNRWYWRVCEQISVFLSILCNDSSILPPRSELYTPHQTPQLSQFPGITEKHFIKHMIHFCMPIFKCGDQKTDTFVTKLLLCITILYWGHILKKMHTVENIQNIHAWNEHLKEPTVLQWKQWYQKLVLVFKFYFIYYKNAKWLNFISYS